MPHARQTHQVSPGAQAFERAVHRLAHAPRDAADGIVDGAKDLIHGIGDTLHRLRF